MQDQSKHSLPGAEGPASYRSSHQAKGQGYEDAFRTRRYRAFLWRRERAVLGGVLSRFAGLTSGTALDFACGTGRILGFLQSRVTRTIGVDISGSMLRVARVSLPGAHLLCADLTRGNALAGQQFGLITAFRFFPNAEPALRRDAMACLVSLLHPDGLLVINNHQHAGSLNARVRRLTGRANVQYMEDADVTRLVEEAGLRVIERHPIGVVPGSDRLLPCPIAAAVMLDRLVVKTAAARLAQDIVYVCRRRS